MVSMSKSILTLLVLTAGFLGTMSCRTEQNSEPPVPGSEINPPQPSAQQGILDLSGLSLPELGPRNIEGEWMFFWEDFIDPVTRMEDIPRGGQPFTMPHSWNGTPWQNRELPGQGYASYALQIRLPRELEQVGLWIPNASTAYTLYADGKPIASSGVPGKTADSSIPRYRISKTMVPVQNGQIMLVLHVSNFHHRRGGLWKAIRIGTVNQIENLQTTETMYDLLLLGNFFALGLYNLFLFFLSPGKPKVSMLLTVFFGVLVVRILMLGQMLVTQVLPEFPWVLQLKLEYLTSHGVPVLLVWIIDLLYPGKLDRRITLAVTGFVLLNFLVMLVTPVLFYSQIVFIYLIGLLIGLSAATLQFILNLIRGDRSALVMIGVILIILFVVLGESVHNWELVLSRDFAPFGFLLELFSQDGTIRSTAHLISTIVAVLSFFVFANLLALAASRKALAVAAASPNPDPQPPALDWPRLHQDYSITKREGELITLVVQGLSNKEIGESLFISEGTVKNHLHNIMQKLGVRNRTELSLRVRALPQDSPETESPQR
ncbi:LuxR C-terminal-related transcriptional regulator [Spirochaeta lutea]|uniref:HTH luxR-type domain-containing protein n=1 Tax=Spirochaeta lutea TaxID=1480694 RepID=A0A098QXB7_9SPIO|nr:LuxR C-terminal-related transcriptional regulator [Spirochaeta lutea]KGE72078.1 hypothetical protein DC28_08230 [Spirochaeta lutea]